MGFEIIYHFFPRKDEGGYDTDSPKTFTKTMGKMEDVPVEKLASAVILELARRDIMVFDVEISEFIKRKVNFKETKGGVLIKNKKFMLDGTVESVPDCGEDVSPPDYLDREMNHQVQTHPSLQPPRPAVYDKPPQQAIRFEVFDPDTPLIPMLQRKYRLTPKRRYGILEEKTVIQRVNLPGAGQTEMPGYEYVIVDDEGKKVRVPAMHFTPPQAPLIGMEQTHQMHAQEEAPRLSYMGNYSDPGMPVLRR